MKHVTDLTYIPFLAVKSDYGRKQHNAYTGKEATERKDFIYVLAGTRKANAKKFEKYFLSLFLTGKHFLTLEIRYISLNIRKYNP
jgi:hypothetical protein